MSSTSKENIQESTRAELGTFSKEKESVILAQLPLPPSVNNAYVSIYQHGKIRRVPNHDLVAFKRDIQKWPMSAHANFLVVKHKVQKWIDDGKVLELRCLIFFKEERLFTKKKTIKKLDVSNRIKALEDGVCDILGICDSVFFRVYAEKAVCHESLNEMACVEILPL